MNNLNFPEQKENYINYSNFNRVVRETRSSVLSVGVSFAGTLFATFQGIQFAQFLIDNKHFESFVFLIIGISLGVLSLALFVTSSILTLEKDLNDELKEAIDSKMITFKKAGPNLLLTETSVFVFLLSEGFIIFSLLSEFIYQFPYIIIIWVLLFLFLSYKIVFHNNFFIKFIPVEF